MANLTHRQLAQLFYRAAHSYSAGIDLRAIFRRESEKGSLRYRRIMQQIGADLDKGVSLSESMRGLGNEFPPLVIATVKAGESGGRLEQGFERLASHFDSLVQFRSRLLVSIAWPVFELVFSVFVIGALILIMGALLDSEDGLTKAPDWFGFGLSTIGNFALFCFLVIVFFGTVTVLVWGTIKGWFGTLPIRIARRIPLLGKTIESLSLSRLSWTMSIAENSGMNAVDTAELALQSTQNYYYTRLEESVTAALRRGEPFYNAFSSTRAFPEDFLIFVDNGETSGQLAETMDRASRNFQETAESNLKILSVVGFVATFLLVAAIMVFAIITIYKQAILKQYDQFL